MQDVRQCGAAEAWCSNATAWSRQLQSSYPAYEDLTQPVARAVHEAARGLRLVAASVAAAAPLPIHRAMSAAAGPGARGRILAVARHLMAFPRPRQWPAGGAGGSEGRGALVLGSPSAQSLAAAVAASAHQEVGMFLPICHFFLPLGGVGRRACHHPKYLHTEVESSGSKLSNSPNYSCVSKIETWSVVRASCCNTRKGLQGFVLVCQ